MFGHIIHQRSPATWAAALHDKVLRRQKQFLTSAGWGVTVWH